jgi:hypothetical protein
MTGKLKGIDHDGVLYDNEEGRKIYSEVLRIMKRKYDIDNIEVKWRDPITLKIKE